MQTDGWTDGFCFRDTAPAKLSGSWRKMCWAYYLKISFSYVPCLSDVLGSIVQPLFPWTPYCEHLSMLSKSSLPGLPWGCRGLQIAHPVLWCWNVGDSWVHTSFNSTLVKVPGAKYLHTSLIMCLRWNPMNAITGSKEMHILSLWLHMPVALRKGIPPHPHTNRVSEVPGFLSMCQKWILPVLKKQSANLLFV